MQNIKRDRKVNRKNNSQTIELVIAALMIAITMVLTMAIQIPVIGTHGYVNMGDTAILFTALYLGKNKGFLAGSIGSALADIVTGYAVYSPITFISKGLEGYVCGLIYEKLNKNDNNLLAKYISTAVGGIIMVSGYFIGEIFLYGIKTSALAVVPNSIQALFGIISAIILYTAISKRKKLS